MTSLSLAPIQIAVFIAGLAQGTGASGTIEADPVPLDVEPVDPELSDEPLPEPQPESATTQPDAVPATPDRGEDGAAALPVVDDAPEPVPPAAAELSPMPDPGPRALPDATPEPEIDDGRPPTLDPRVHTDEPAPPLPPLPRDVVRTPPDGLVPNWVAAAGQYTVGLAGCLGVYSLVALVGFPVGFIPIIGPIIGPCFVQCAFCAGASIVSGTSQVLVGDLLSSQRGDLLTAIGAELLAHTAVGAISSVIGLGLTGAATAAIAVRDGGLPRDPQQLSVVVVLDPLFLIASMITAVIFLGLTALAAGAPTVAYALLADDKRPGDDGSVRLPGLWAPNHPEGTTPLSDEERRRLDGLTMAY